MPLPKVMITRIMAALLLITLASLAVCSLARADGDPASDYLIGSPVFYPYSPPVSAGLVKLLNAEANATARARFPIKVALIGSPSDLGSVPSFFGKPQQYATFLDQEITFVGQAPPPLLVVMPGGYGVAGLPIGAAGALTALPKPSGSQSDDLARAALLALPRLALASGHRIPATPRPTAGDTQTSNGGAGTTAIVIIAIAAVATAGGIIALRRKLSHNR